MRQDPFGVVVRGGDGRRWSIDGEVAMEGGGAPTGGEPLILGRPVAGARHGGFLGSVGRWWGYSGERFRNSGESKANLAGGATMFEWPP